jgi:hypothetical protein
MMGHMPFFARLLHCGSQPFYSKPYDLALREASYL